MRAGAVANPGAFASIPTPGRSCRFVQPVRYLSFSTMPELRTRLRAWAFFLQSTGDKGLNSNLWRLSRH
jgi:hypothetical protein